MCTMTVAAQAITLGSPSLDEAIVPFVCMQLAVKLDQNNMSMLGIRLLSGVKVFAELCSSHGMPARMQIMYMLLLISSDAPWRDDDPVSAVLIWCVSIMTGVHPHPPSPYTTPCSAPQNKVQVYDRFGCHVCFMKQVSGWACNSL